MITMVLSLALVPAMGNDQIIVSKETVIRAIRKAVGYYRDRVAVQGGYVYHYSLDLEKRWGEGLATPHQVWVQPPGTPSLGMAYLQAYRATGDRYYLEAAREAAEVLVYGQLRTGGWTNHIDCSGRFEGQRYWGGDSRREGTSSLDDGQTQSAIKLLVLVDEALDFKDRRIHESAGLALDALLAAQFPNGGFPQGWKGPVTQQPVLRASYPDYDWRTEGRIKHYWDMYTLNDNVCGYVADTLIGAYRIYQNAYYKTALERLGDFLLLAQMPEPQPAWAQQYSYDMHPIWARKFEPAAIAGDESQEVMETLMRIADATGNPQYLAPIPAALAYLSRSLLPDGRLARFYELETNRPLYMLRRGQQYELTYDDTRLPRHYGWKIEARLTELEARYLAVKGSGRLPGPTDAERASLVDKVTRVMQSLDDQGRWVSTYEGESLVGQPKFERGSRYLSSDLFCRNLAILCDFLQALPRE